MARIPDEIVRDVQARADMLAVIGEYVSLKKAGPTYKGLCPFHGEKTPSFGVSPDKGFFKCFGCGEGGDLYHFLMKIEGFGFADAVRYLAGKVGVEVEDSETPEEAQEREGKEALHRVMKRAGAFFEAQLWGEGGAEARAYLAQRGVDEATARSFGLGWAPEGWSHLTDHLASKGTSEALMVSAGLAVVKEGRSGAYDRFRGRIMFPVRDTWGHVLAFSGRILKDDPAHPGAKYVNSPETPIYTKGKVVFGLDVARGSMRQGGAVLVEGNFDVVTLHARGITGAVAPLGTALTPEQVKVISRYTRNILLAFDGDKAGVEATLKALPVLLGQDVEASVVEIDASDDPDSILQREGAAGWARRVGLAQPITGWALNRLLTPAQGAAVEVRSRATQEAGDLLALVKDSIALTHYTREVSRRLDVLPEDVQRAISRAKQRGRAATSRSSPPRISSPPAPTAPTTPLDPSIHPPHRPDPSREVDPEVLESLGWGEAKEEVGAAPLTASDLAALHYTPPGDAAPSAPTPATDSRRGLTVPPLEMALLRFLADKVERVPAFLAHDADTMLTDDRIAHMVQHMAGLIERGQTLNVASITREIAQQWHDPDLERQITSAMMQERPWEDDKQADQGFYDTVIRLQRDYLRREQEALARVAMDLQRSGGDVMTLATEMARLVDARRELDAPLQRKIEQRREHKARMAASEARIARFMEREAAGAS